MDRILGNEEQVEALAALFGNKMLLAKACGVKPSTVSMWKRNGIPANRRLQLIDVADRQCLILPDWVVPKQRAAT